MSRTERGYGRTWTWSVFHRCMPKPAYMIDLDQLECCEFCKKPIFIAEIARDFGQFKPTTILSRLAQSANILGFLIYYSDNVISDAINTLFPELNNGSMPELNEFQLKKLWAHLRNDSKPFIRVIQIQPRGNGEQHLAAGQFYELIFDLHKQHLETCLYQPHDLFRIPTKVEPSTTPARGAS